MQVSLEFTQEWMPDLVERKEASLESHLLNILAGMSCLVYGLAR